MFFRKKKPYIKFELDGDGVNIESFFTNEVDDNKAINFVKNYANMLIFIQSGQLLNKINESVSRTSMKNGCYDLSISINKITTTLLSDFYSYSDKKAKNVNKFCMNPEDVFLVKND